MVIFQLRRRFFSLDVLAGGKTEDGGSFRHIRGGGGTGRVGAKRIEVEGLGSGVLGFKANLRSEGQEF